MDDKHESATADIASIRQRLKSIEEEKAALEKRLTELIRIEAETSSKNAAILSPADKISRFMSLFACRTDVYPRLWENQKKGTIGYSPVCGNEWKPGVCNKPKIKCHECRNRAFVPFTGEAAKAHLEGRIVAGMYAIRQDDTCCFLAADFDGEGWRDDVVSYSKAAESIGVPAAIEISRSGNGAHAWIFFSEPVAAADARRLGFIILSVAQKNRGVLETGSYDRFFPNQDVLPEGGFGNLISLPLQRKLRDSGKTVFVDESLTPYPDQWAFLESIERISVLSVAEKCDVFKQDSIEYEVTYPAAETSAELPVNMPVAAHSSLEIGLGAGVEIDLRKIPARVAHELSRLATFPNPKFFELQNMRFSTWGTPRYICAAWKEGEFLVLPRGVLSESVRALEGAGFSVKVTDARPQFAEIEVEFRGELYPHQKEAVSQILSADFGVLKAPPGSGKTVMGCAVIASRKLPTLVIVHRDQLVSQWQDQIVKLLGIEKKKIGVYGGTRRKLKGCVDIAMVQSLSRCEDVKKMLSGYGHIVVDECHHIPAVTFENILREASPRYVLGLSATPYRKDGLQKIMFLQCGPIRYELEERDRHALNRTVVVKECGSSAPEIESKTLQLHEIWAMIASDTERQKMIASDVAQTIMDGRFPLVLSDRKEHLLYLREAIASHGGVAKERMFILTGDSSKKERRTVLQAIRTMIDSGCMPCILSTGALVGEGFDLPECDTLFLAMPVSFKGRMIQYAGRLHREHGDKDDVIIYDYVDTGIGLTLSMFKKRISAYREMGYEIVLQENSVLEKFASKRKLVIR